MSKYEASIPEFLERIVKSIGSSKAQITKRQLEISLAEFVRGGKIKYDPVLLLDEWEASLRKTWLISGHLVYYSMARETLQVERMPSVEQMKYFAEMYSNNIEQALKRRIIDLTPRALENLAEFVFQRVIWTSGVVRTPLTRDGGFDFVGTFVDLESGLKLKLLGEVKHRTKAISPSDARDFLGTIFDVARGSACCGIYISTGGFSTEALKIFKRSSVRIMTYDIDDLVKLMIRERVGVRKFKIEGLVINEQLWTELQQ